MKSQSPGRMVRAPGAGRGGESVRRRLARASVRRTDRRRLTGPLLVKSASAPPSPPATTTSRTTAACTWSTCCRPSPGSCASTRGGFVRRSGNRCRFPYPFEIKLQATCHAVLRLRSAIEHMFMSRIAILEHGSVAINCDAGPCECEKPSGQFERLDGVLDSTTALKWIAMKFEQ